ncbi:MAG: hypothetical protein FWC56_04160, partial [Phycisphaerae bacterium]|nr:hypothetical protein [Phycisphaerae bacterium]
MKVSIRAIIASICVLVPLSGLMADNYIAKDLSDATIDKSEVLGIANNQLVGWIFQTGASGNHAILVDANLQAISLHSDPYSLTEAWGTDGQHQVGQGKKDGNFHALMWAGTAESVVDLSSANFVSSRAIGTVGGKQIGSGIVPSAGVDGPKSHAILWNGTAADFTDLNPGGFDSSEGWGIDSNQQVGNGVIGGKHHALLWTGTAGSVVDLHPSGYDESWAYGVSGGQQGGFGIIGTKNHALLWSGSAESVVDLNPAGFDESGINGMANGRQVGNGYIGGKSHALLWKGTAESVVDLHGLLGDQFTESSANGVDANGNIVGRATDLSGKSHAVAWLVDADGDGIPDITQCTGDNCGDNGGGDNNNGGGNNNPTTPAGCGGCGV